MKKKTAALLSVFVSLALAASAFAQTRPADPGTKREPARAERPAWAPDARAVEANKLVGMKVRTTQGKDVGEIDKLIVNHADGKITHVVIGKGGVMGVGEQRLVLAWADLKVQHDTGNRNKMIAMVDQTKLDSAPRYEARAERKISPAASPPTAPSSSGEQKGEPKK